MVSINNATATELRVSEDSSLLLNHTRNDIQTRLLSTQWRQIPPGEDDIPFIYPNDRMEKDGYMALKVQGAAHV